MKKKNDGDEVGPEDEAVLLEDLAPREDVRGGAGKIRFGQEIPGRRLPAEERPGAKKRPG
jgi:hypothetical protein